MDATAKESNKKPEIIVFAGPNGSGKSTFTELLKPPVDYINADEIKKNLKRKEKDQLLPAAAKCA